MSGQPTVGRIVHYTLNDGDVRAIDVAGRRHRNSVTAGDVYPAVVVRTFGGSTCNLQVLLDGEGSYWATSRAEGDQPGNWAWPPRT